MYIYDDNSPYSLKLLTQMCEMGSAILAESQNYEGILPFDIRPLNPRVTLIGKAITVSLPENDNLSVHLAMKIARAGDILVVDCQGRRDCAVWGELLTTEALRIGLGGVVINGFVKNANAIAEMGLPVFTLGTALRKPCKTRAGRINEPVAFPGCTISAGDVIMGDRDGVVAIKQHRVNEIYGYALLNYSENINRKAKIASGVSVLDAMCFDCDNEMLLSLKSVQK